MAKDNLKIKIGHLVHEARVSRGLTQSQLAKSLNTSQSAINRIENGNQNISLEMLSKLSNVLTSQLLSLNPSRSINFRIEGGHPLKGCIEVNTSKNAAVALLCASLVNKGKTTLRHLAKIEEVYRIVEVLQSLGVKAKWINSTDLELIPPKRLDLENINLESARLTRSVIMLFGPLLHYFNDFKLPYAGGCAIGERTVEPHLRALKHFGLVVNASAGYYHATSAKLKPEQSIVLSERGDTVTENVLMSASLNDGITIIRNASPNYMVQDLCFFLQKLGVKIDGIGTTTLKIEGLKQINKDIEYYPSEDPIEAMSFISAAVVTKSEITIKRAPIEFLEIELEYLAEMGFEYQQSDEYTSKNNHTRLVDITTKISKLRAPHDKIHPLPFPGINIDNLPFFALIAATASGRTLIHDWVYENRAIYLLELNKLNARVQLLDPHRVYIEGPTKWKPTEIVTPPALRPAVVIFLAMLAAPGVSILRNVYSINRGYEDLANRLNGLGAKISIIHDLAG